MSDTPWKIDDTAQSDTPWKVDDTQQQVQPSDVPTAENLQQAPVAHQNMQGVDNIPLLNKLAGGFETALSMGTGAVAAPIGTVKGVLQSIVDRSIGTSHDTAQKTAAKFTGDYTYQPKTQAGQDMLSGAGDLLSESGLNGIAPLAEMSSLSRLGNVTSTNKAQAALDLKKSQNLTHDTMMADSRKAGYVMPPSAMGAGSGVNAVEGLSGKVKLQQLAITKNQPITNKLAKQDLGLPDSVSLNEQVLAKDRYNKSAPYREVEDLPESIVGHEVTRSQGTGAVVTKDVVKSGKDLIDELTQTRAASKRYWQASGTGMHPEAYDKAISLDAHAEKIEGQIVKVAQANGDAGLVDRLKLARRDIAKNHLYDNALNDSTGNVDAISLGKAKDRGVPVDGHALTIAKFANGFRESARMPRAGDADPTTAVDAGLGALIGAGHLATGGIPLTAVVAPLATRIGTRYGLLSKYMQNKLASPSYDAGISPSEVSSMILNSSKQAAPMLPATTGAFSNK